MKPLRRMKGASAEDVARFLSRSSDDACCAWLCETAGALTGPQAEGLAQATHELSRGAFDPKKALPTSADMIRRVS